MHDRGIRTGLKLFCAASVLLLTGASGGGASCGRVYVQTNDPAGNEVVIYAQRSDGSLKEAGRVSTAGVGTGGGLGNQGALALSEDGRWLFAVNAGSDTLSVLAVERDRLTLADVASTGGATPVSVTVHRDRVFVLNGGGAGSITGWRVRGDGVLVPLAGSTQPLSGAASTAPAQISFTPDGKQLVVTEKATNQIDVYEVSPHGAVTGPMVHASAGQTPFGFAFARGEVLVVSEAAGGATDASSASSYRPGTNGALTTISASAATTETAACWTAATLDGKYAYTTNTGSSSVTGFRVEGNGQLTILNADGVTGRTGANSRPADLDASSDGKYLYVLDRPNGAVRGFRLNANGSLTALSSSAVGLPTFATGLIAD